jgi:hypothetical protein
MSLRIIEGGESTRPPLLNQNSDIMLSVSVLGLCLKELTQEDLRAIKESILRALPKYTASCSVRVERLQVSDIHEALHGRIKK